MILLEPQDLLVAWCCERIQLAPTPNARAIGSANDKGELLGVVLYDYFTGTACDMHMAGGNSFFTREFLRVIFAYPFQQLNCKLVIAQISTANDLALDIVKRIGFKQQFILKDAQEDGDAVILTMYRNECRWLEKRHGTQKAATQEELEAAQSA